MDIIQISFYFESAARMLKKSFFIAIFFCASSLQAKPELMESQGFRLVFSHTQKPCFADNEKFLLRNLARLTKFKERMKPCSDHDAFTQPMRTSMLLGRRFDEILGRSHKSEVWVDHETKRVVFKLIEQKPDGLCPKCVPLEGTIHLAVIKRLPDDYKFFIDMTVYPYRPKN